MNVESTAPATDGKPISMPAPPKVPTVKKAPKPKAKKAAPKKAAKKAPAKKPAKSKAVKPAKKSAKKPPAGKSKAVKKSKPKAAKKGGKAPKRQVERCARLDIRCTPKERATVIAAAKRKGMTLTAVVMAAIGKLK